MIRPIMRNQLFLAMPSEAAAIEDAPVGQDLLDTLEAHAHECVGMAANMIGVRKRIIVFDDNGMAKLMFNPEIVHASSEYSTEE
uniref:peptide deformylase n=1 Tax=uncultured Senegalimassilia sp. TaxID=1714350 RepID=UPI0025CFDFB0